MHCFVSGNFAFVLQGKPDVIQTIQQAMPHEFVDRELRAKTLFVAHLALFQIDDEFVIFFLASAPHHLSGCLLAELHGKKTILGAVVGKDIGEGGRNDGAESKISQRPYRVLTRGTAAEILPRNQNARACVARLVQNETCAFLTVAGKTPVVKQELAEAGALNALQKLLRNNLIGIDVHPIKRCHASAMRTKWFLGCISPPPRSEEH